MPSNLSILFAIVSHTTHLSHTLHPLHYGDYSPDLEAVLEAPTTIPAATTLTIFFIKAGSKNGFDPTTGATGGGILSPLVCLIPRALIHLPNGTTNHLEVSLTRPFSSTLMLQVYMRVGVCQGILVWITFITKILITSPN